VIDTFDSRVLRRTDCYGQRFMRPGVYQYDVVLTGGHAMTLERPYRIEVTAGQPGTAMRQFNVSVHQEGRRFTVDEPVLSIEEGDLVIWNCSNATAGFAIAGEEEFFGNDALVNECGFSHAFSAAGKYEWVDAHGSGLAGVVTVSDPSCKTATDLREWREALARGTLVMIADGKAEPAEVSVLTGQTVYFAVVKGPGITVTDRRIVEAAGDHGSCFSPVHG
jgi:plastocyanin